MGISFWGSVKIMEWKNCLELDVGSLELVSHRTVAFLNYTHFSHCSQRFETSTRPIAWQKLLGHTGWHRSA